MARSLRIARATPQKKSTPTKKKVTTRTARERSAQASPIARAVTQRDVSKRTRRLVFGGLGLAFLAIGMMLLVVVFQTRIAGTQMNIDKIESEISAERERYNALRLERSSLRNPARLVSEATAFGMIPGNGTDFVSVDPMTVAQVLVATGGVDPAFLKMPRAGLVTRCSF